MSYCICIALNLASGKYPCRRWPRTRRTGSSPRGAAETSTQGWRSEEYYTK